MKRKNQIVLLFILSFLIGLMSGALLTGMFFKQKIDAFSEKPDARREILMNRFSRELGLTEDQEAILSLSIIGFFTDIEKDRIAFTDTIRPKFREMLDNVEQSLTAEQTDRLEEMIRQLYPFIGNYQQNTE